MRKISIILFACTAILFTSCQQEIEDIINNPGGNNNNTTSGNYQPMTTGSWWKYKDSASGNLSTSTLINVTKTVNSIVYRAAQAQPSTPDTAWYAANTPNYYMAAKGYSPTSGAPYDLTMHYLNDTASVGYSWVYNAGQGNGFTAINTTTILEKGLSMTVEGKNYTDVIHTQMNIAYDIFGQIMDFGFYDFWVAKNVGIIKVRTTITFGGANSEMTTSLVDHHIQ